MIKTVKSMGLCDFIVIFLYGMSCFSCISEFFKAALLEIPCFYNNQDCSVLPLSDSILFWIGAFCLFAFLYSKQCGLFRHRLASFLLLIITFIISAIFSERLLQTEQVILISAFAMIIPIYLLCMYSSISKNIKSEDIQKV